MIKLDIRNNKGLTEKEFLEQYKPGDYDRPSVTVDMLLFTVDDTKIDNNKELPNKELKILLIKRKDHPFIGQWAIPGGFIDINEDIDSAVYRELKEETNIENVFMEQLYTWGKAKRDPRMRVISTSYLALVSKDGLNPIAGDDAEEVMWFTVKKELLEVLDDKEVHCLYLMSEDESISIKYKIIETFKKNGIIKTKDVEVISDSENKLAFDHSEIINLAIDRLRSKITYTDIVFNLLPEYFTLTELQRVYEAILGKKLTTSNFRRDIKHKVESTDKVFSEYKVGKTVAFRPAKLFKYKA